MNHALRPSSSLLTLTLLASTATAQWSESTMPAAQSQMASAQTGPYLLFAGGRGAVNHVQAFDASAGIWIPAQPLSLGRENLSGATVGSRAVFAGGSIGNLMGRDRVDVYDSSVGPPADPAAWSTLTLPNPRCMHASAAIGSKVIFARGIDGGTNAVSSADVYDFATGTWSTVPLSAGGAGAVATVVGTKVLIAGGITQAGETDLVDIYDDATGTWSTASLSEPRGGWPFGGMGATTAGSLAIFAGGRLSWFGGGSSNVVDIYDDSTGTWSVATLSRARTGVAAATVGGRVLFAGGQITSFGSSRTLDVVDVFDPASGEWSTARLASGRKTGPPLVMGDTAYFAGGFSGSGGNQQNTFESYTAPDVVLGIAGGVPDRLDRSGASLSVELSERAPGVFVPGSARLHFDAGAGPVQLPLGAGGPTGLTAAFPSFDCGTTVEWYLSAQSTSGATFTFPERAPVDVLSSIATNTPPASFFDMESADGWSEGAPGDTATSGLWERGDPIGDEAAPEYDHTPSPGSNCWTTGLQAGEDLDGGTTTLLSPVMDLFDLPDPFVSYWRWVASTSTADELVVSITSDGVVWHEIESVHGASTASGFGGWLRHDTRLLDLPGFVLTSSVQLRFAATDVGQDNVAEFAIDDVRVSGCTTGPGGTYCAAAVNSTGETSSLVGMGTSDVSANDVTLFAADLPVNATGFFLTSRQSGLTTSVPGSSGTLCLGGAIGRYVGPGQVKNSGLLGFFSLTLDLTMTPTPTGLVPVTAGESWYFQAWHRDTSIFGPTSNFTNGYVIAFE